MSQYRPPLRDIHFVLHELLHVADRYAAMPRYADCDAETIDSVIAEAGRFSSEVVFPLNAPGDAEGCHFHDGAVTTPKGFREAYRQYVEAGWPALASAPEFGGQGLPELVNSALMEMLNSANQAWAMYPSLSHGAYTALMAYGSDEQRKTYLPHIVSGEWTCTMCLTEPQCGTDLGLVRTHAQPRTDGSWSISGTKMFISSGEHDLTDNIVHLVLARLPDAPAGSRGISLFIVPKFIVGGDGQLGARNAVQCASIEEKMGIHGNATCVMNFEDAQGWLVGKPHHGLQAMFVMMNGARLGVGIQGLGLTEVAYQNSLAYARQRLQMRSPTRRAMPDKPADPIIVHPDVRRMLLTQKAWLEAARALTYWLGLLIDEEHAHPDEATREQAGRLVALLTPVAKAFLTENGFASTSLAMQIYGGHGYIRDNGMEQYLRDARITMIYEGTNAIQALDLLGRKVLGDSGAALKALGAHIAGFVQQQKGDATLQPFCTALLKLLEETAEVTQELGHKALKNPDEVGAAATPYLRVIGHVVFGYLWLRMACVGRDRLAAGAHGEEAFYRAKLATANYYFSKLFPEAFHELRVVRAGSAPLMDFADEGF